MDLSVLIKNLLLVPDTQASFPYLVSSTALQHRSFKTQKAAAQLDPSPPTWVHSQDQVQPSVTAYCLAHSNDSRPTLPHALAGISGFSFFSNSSPLFPASPSSLAWAKSQSQISVTWKGGNKKELVMEQRQPMLARAGIGCCWRQGAKAAVPAQQVPSAELLRRAAAQVPREKSLLIRLCQGNVFDAFLTA